MDHETRQEARDQLLFMTERLIAQYAGALPAGAVMRCVSRVFEELSQAGVRWPYLLEATERATRLRLTARIPAYGLA